MADTGSIMALAVTLFSTLAGVIPIYLGLIITKIISGASGKFHSYSPAISLGILLSTFYDLLQETAGLQQAAMNPISQTMSVVLFLIGLLILQLLLRGQLGGVQRELTTVLIYGWAVGIGLHGFGEGIVIGYGFVSNQPTIVGPIQVVSYGLHKILEGFTLGTLLAVSSQKLGRWALNGLIAGLPVGLGAALGFLMFPAELSTYAFAIGAGFAAYFIIQFSRLLPAQSRTMYAAVAAGFLFMYFAGLLHQF